MHEVDLVFIRFGYASKGWKFEMNAIHSFIGVFENLVALILRWIWIYLSFDCAILAFVQLIRAMGQWGDGAMLYGVDVTPK